MTASAAKPGSIGRSQATFADRATLACYNKTMDQTIQAVYQHGVLRPLTPLPLREDEVVSVTVSRPDDGEPQVVAETRRGEEQRDIVLRFVSKMESLPVRCPQDGLTNRDHDRLIYGR